MLAPPVKPRFFFKTIFYRVDVLFLDMGRGWGDGNVHVNYYVPYVGYGGGWGLGCGVMVTLMWTTTLHTLGMGVGGGWGDGNVHPTTTFISIKTFGGGLTAGSTDTTMATTFGQLCHMSWSTSEKAEWKRARVLRAALPCLWHWVSHIISLVVGWYPEKRKNMCKNMCIFKHIISFCA